MSRPLYSWPAKAVARLRQEVSCIVNVSKGEGGCGRGEAFCVIDLARAGTHKQTKYTQAVEAFLPRSHADRFSGYRDVSAAGCIKSGGAAGLRLLTGTAS